MAKVKVLYADDDRSMHERFAMSFSSMGREVVVVDDGARAWELLDKGDMFDAVVSDWNMPEMDGLALMRKLRSDPRFADLPFALMSGNDKEAAGGRALADICKEAGSVFFQKGMDGLNALESWLESLNPA